MRPIRSHPQASTAVGRLERLNKLTSRRKVPSTCSPIPILCTSQLTCCIGLHAYFLRVLHSLFYWARAPLRLLQIYLTDGSHTDSVRSSSLLPRTSIVTRLSLRFLDVLDPLVLPTPANCRSESCPHLLVETSVFLILMMVGRLWILAGLAVVAHAIEVDWESTGMSFYLLSQRTAEHFFFLQQRRCCEDSPIILSLMPLPIVLERNIR